MIYNTITSELEQTYGTDCALSYIAGLSVVEDEAFVSEVEEIWSSSPLAASKKLMLKTLSITERRELLRATGSAHKAYCYVEDLVLDGVEAGFQDALRYAVINLKGFTASSHQRIHIKP